MTQAKKLTALQIRFADEYLVDLVAVAAYIRAGYKARGNGAEVNASKLLKDPRIQAYIQERMKAREKRTEITQDMVLQRWWAIANADPNELIYHRLVCCRYCFGVNHAYQWIDETEYTNTVTTIKLMDKKKRPPIPSNVGGYGFDETIRPHPKCPKCHGEGHGQIRATDTRDLSPQAKMLYAGVKQTQGGFEIKMQSQEKALENVARHLDMFKEKVELTGAEGVPLQVVFNIPRPPKENKS